MNPFDTSRFGIDDIGDVLNLLLNQRGDELEPQQRTELQQRQQMIEQARSTGDQSMAFGDRGKEGMVDDIMRIAGPAVAGYLVRMLQDRLTGNRDEAQAIPTTTNNYERSTPSTPQYGTYQEGDAIHRSGPGGQSVEETD